VPPPQNSGAYASDGHHPSDLLAQPRGSLEAWAATTHGASTPPPDSSPLFERKWSATSSKLSPRRRDTSTLSRTCTSLRTSSTPAWCTLAAVLSSWWDGSTSVDSEAGKQPTSGHWTLSTPGTPNLWRRLRTSTGIYLSLDKHLAHVSIARVDLFGYRWDIDELHRAVEAVARTFRTELKGQAPEKFAELEPWFRYADKASIFCVRSKAWIWDFSSTLRTIAFSGSMNAPNAKPVTSPNNGAPIARCRAVLGCGRRVGSHGLLPARGQWSCGGAPARRCCAGRGPVG